MKFAEAEKDSMMVEHVSNSISLWFKIKKFKRLLAGLKGSKKYLKGRKGFKLAKQDWKKWISLNKEARTPSKIKSAARLENLMRGRGFKLGTGNSSKFVNFLRKGTYKPKPVKILKAMKKSLIIEGIQTAFNIFSVYKSAKSLAESQNFGLYNQAADDLGKVIDEVFLAHQCLKTMLDSGQEPKPYLANAAEKVKQQLKKQKFQGWDVQFEIQKYDCLLTWVEQKTTTGYYNGQMHTNTKYLHGRGSMTWKSGRHYTGYWNRGRMQGPGYLIGVKGNWMQGTFHKDKVHDPSGKSISWGWLNGPIIINTPVFNGKVVGKGFYYDPTTCLQANVTYNNQKLVSYSIICYNCCM